MLEVTEEALRFFLRSLEQRQAPDDVAMRLSRKDARTIEVAPDKEQPGDRGFDFQERTVLVMDKTLAEEMDGKRLRLVETENGSTELHLDSR